MATEVTEGLLMAIEERMPEAYPADFCRIGKSANGTQRWLHKPTGRRLDEVEPTKPGEISDVSPGEPAKAWFPDKLTARTEWGSYHVIGSWSGLHRKWVVDGAFPIRHEIPASWDTPIRMQICQDITTALESELGQRVYMADHTFLDNDPVHWR